MQIDLPYGNDTVAIKVPEDKLMGVFLPRSLPAVPDPSAVLHRALTEPIDSPPLREMVSPGQTIAICIEDSTRPVPNALIVASIMNELVAAGVDPQHVRVITALGLHRVMSDDELAEAVGQWFGKVRCENHDANNPASLRRVGVTHLGTEISVNRTFMEADFKITTGDVEFHQFCGYGGGAKCVYPGLADAAAIRTNHSRMDLPGTGPGRIDGNPVREEVNEVGRMVGIDFNLSVALDEMHRIVGVCAGEPDKSFREACKFVDQMYAVELPARADLVIASPGGHPKDINLYQAQKAIEEATLAVQLGGNVFITARCGEGSGSNRFEAWMQQAYTANDVIQRIEKAFVMGGHKAYQIAREVQRASVHLYSDLPPGQVRSWMMKPVASISEVEQLIAVSQSVLVLPQATLVSTRIAPGA